MPLSSPLTLVHRRFPLRDLGESKQVVNLEREAHRW